VIIFAGVLLLVGSAAFPQNPAPAAESIETRFAIHNKRPSEIAHKFNIIGGMNTGGRVVFTPEDAAHTLVAKIYPAPGSTHVEREQLRLTVEDAVARYDVPEERIPVDLYVVRTDLLDDEQFRTLDSAFKKGAPPLNRGENARGVVFRKPLELTNLEIASFGETQDELRAVTQPEPVTAKGSAMASIRPGDRTLVSLDMEVSAGAMGKGSKGEPRHLKISGSSVFSQTGAVVFAGGEMRVMRDELPNPPVRHEVMVYIVAAKPMEVATN